MAQPIPAITLPDVQNPQQEKEWLKTNLHQWLDEEFLPEPVNVAIAERAAQIYLRQRMEGENDLGSLVVAIVTEMQAFDFSKSFYGEFAIANAVSDIILASLGIDSCCGNWIFQLLAFNSKLILLTKKTAQKKLFFLRKESNIKAFSPLPFSYNCCEA